MRKNAALFALLALTNSMAAAGCATLFRKSTQVIPITSSPAGARVSVGGKALGTTPLSISVSRTIKGQVIRIESPGYNPVEIRPRRTIVGEPVLGDFLIGLVLGLGAAAGYSFRHNEDPDYQGSTALLIGGAVTAAVGGIILAIDLGGGKGNTLTPTELDVTLTKANGPPKVDTVLVDAGRLRNIKWIRVHED